MDLPHPTDKGRPKEIASARAINSAMILLLFVAGASFVGWQIYHFARLLVEDHGAKQNDHFRHLMMAILPLIPLTAMFVRWRRGRRANRSVS